jgi:hypothetical protein
VKILVGVLLCRLGIHRWSDEYLQPPMTYYRHCHRCMKKWITRVSWGHDHFNQ